MKHCKHTHWLSLCSHGGERVLLESDRLQSLVKDIPHPESQHPSLFTLFGNTEKSIALKSVFGIKRNRKLTRRRSKGQVHLHIDPSSLFNNRPILIAESDLLEQQINNEDSGTVKCHEVIRRPVQSPKKCHTAADLHTHLLFPFVDVFCFFASDLGGFRPIAQFLAQWLDHSSSLPDRVLPGILIVTDKPSLKAETEEEARATFLSILQQETTKDIFKQISTINILTLFPSGMMSNQARYRCFKERLLGISDQVRENRKETRYLFSVTHFAALLRSAGVHFTESPGQPFTFVTASRAHNPVAPELHEHLSNFLRQVTSPSQLIDFAAPMVASALFLDSYPPGAHAFDPRAIFNTIYKNSLLMVSNARVISFDQSQDVILRTGLVSLVEENFVRCFNRYVSKSEISAIEIHKDNLYLFQNRWYDIKSTNSCLCCLQRRPQYCLPCGHCICENCVVVFGSRSDADPWVYNINKCYLCQQEVDEAIMVRIKPPTAGVGVLCIDGGGTRGIVPLTVMKLLQDRLGPIPLQRCINVGFGVSVGVIIAIDHFVLGRPIEESIKTFSDLAGRVFKRRVSSSIPLLSRIAESLLSYFKDGLYSASNVDDVLRDWIKDKKVLDCSYATSTGTKIGFPVATVSDFPSYRFFTNYNGVGKRDKYQETEVIRTKDGLGNVLLWEIARAASAAPGFFPPKHIKGVGSLQDAGGLRNDPVPDALSELSAMYPHIKEPAFVLSLGTGEPGEKNYVTSTEASQKDGMIKRLYSLVAERMRDKVVRRACKTIGLRTDIFHKIHRLNVDYEAIEPRLDDASCIPELISKVKTDYSLSTKIDEVVQCLKAALFYFELDSIPERRDGKHIVTGYLLCSITNADPAFEGLFNELKSTARFIVDDWSVLEPIENPSNFGRDGFRLRLETTTFDTFAISLKQGGRKPYHISGSPFSVSQLVEAQGLYAPFGREDHGKRKRPRPYGLQYLPNKRQCRYYR